MKVQDRKEKAFIHKALIDILTDCPNDMAYLKRLIFAQEIIAKSVFESLLITIFIHFDNYI